MKYLIPLIIICFISCQSKSNQEKSTNKEGEVMLIGTIDPGELVIAPYVSWYDSTYHAYTPELDQNEIFLSALSDIDIEIFFGTWCSDSRRELPAFHKILDELQMEKSDVKHVALNRDKIEPGQSQDGRNIEFVPTIIFSKNGKEIGRIIESPEISLEQDMLKILSDSEVSQ